MTETAVAQLYQRFADREARGVSDVYFDWATGIARDAGVLQLVAGLPERKRQPNLVFAAARLGGAPEAGYAEMRDWLVARWVDVLAQVMARSTQTNEAARCAVLLPVLSRLPGRLALIEVGASAGLCLLPDRYSYLYEAPGCTVRLDPDDGPSAVAIRCRIDEQSVPTRLPLVAWRAGVDLNPLSVRDPDERAWLTTLVWPEHEERRARLAAAFEIAAADPPNVQRGDMLEALPGLVASTPADCHVVVFHSAVLAYVDLDVRQKFSELMRSLPNVTWISNEGRNILPRITRQLRRDPDGRMVVSVNGRATALAGAHGDSYEAVVDR
ncbi:DUF2332 domain-containing protein [Agreia sp. COWG]|uniref:DUF2332 domain-containing protein n=1 Tax=Agreia sp. COWG TaxID=2773266 RepID=UPI001927D79C|nr:DUF2332 domain-containing protein [Agreia sp. COWG]